MVATQPVGESVPEDGSLPTAVLKQLRRRDLGVYLHVPFCTVRCGYCDFNTYTAAQLGGLSQADYLAAMHAEIDLARRVLGSQLPAISTVFIGGGTPSLLPGADLAGLLDHLRADFTFAPDVEITTEANPESTTPELLAQWRGAGINRLSLGMQSAVPEVLVVLDRRHTPGRVSEVVAQARSAGFDNISLDLIMGTPGETMTDWRASLEAVLANQVEHVSAYALIVEEGTALARRIATGELPAPDDDDLADKYLVAEELLVAAGYFNYEVSNWARADPQNARDLRSRHNLAYWTSQNWWGFGPGAHSHVGGVRWWNLKHPARYAAQLQRGLTPGAGREILDEGSRRVERVLLELRIDEGLPVEVLSLTEQARLPTLIERGLVAVAGQRARLTLAGRLLGDAVVRDLVD